MMDSLGSDTQTALEAGDYGFYAPTAVERRLFRFLFIIIAVGAASAAIFASISVVFGIVLGGLLSVVNLKWLAASLRGIFELNRETGRSKTPPGTMMKFILRWLLIGGVGYAANLTGLFSSAGIIAGLLAPAAAILVEAFYCTYKMLVESEAI